MGIDVYLWWPKQTREQHDNQITGFGTAGDAGYLREAYHGGPYATRVLIPEGFADSDDAEYGVRIPAATLRERLPYALAAAAERSEKVYGGPDVTQLKAITDFVELAERMESEAGEVRVLVSW